MTEPVEPMRPRLRGLVVQKFGGTSVGTPERIRSVAGRIARTRAQGAQLVIAVSAMGDTTDDLIGLARQVSKTPPDREMDMLLSAGERVSMALLSMALSDLDIPARSFTGSQSGIITSRSHRRAQIKRILGDRVKSALSSGFVAIVAGFQGVSEEKEITTLGRGGTDTTAVALASALGAELCEIYTDVDGVYSADPRVVSSAKLWKRLPHDLMVEMATRGAGVLHPRSVQLARRFGVPVRVRNSLNETEGTLIADRGNGDVAMEEFLITGVTADKGKALVSVDLERPSAAGSVWHHAREGHLSILAPIFWGSLLRFFADRDCLDEWRHQLQNLARDGFVKQFEIQENCVPLSVIGDRFSQDGSALSEVLETLALNHISVTMGTASALAITVGVSVDHADDGVRALHSRFLEPQVGSS